MRIVHTESSQGWGGQEIRILTESREFIKCGYDVRVIADPDSLIFKRASDFGVPVTPARLKRKRLLDFLSTRKAIKQISPRFIICHSSTDHWISALARLTFRKRPVLIRVRHVSAKVRRDPFTCWLYNSGAEKVITTSSQITQSLTFDRFLPSEKVVTIPTGIDLQVFSPNSKATARRKLGLPSNHFVFGNIATLRSWKGHHDLIRAFRGLQDSVDRPCLLLIVGDGPQYESLQEYASTLGITDQIIFTGHQSDVRPFLDAMDCFVFPSYANEGVPQAVLQAIAYGLPLAVSRHPGVIEACRDYPNIKVFDPRDIDALKKSLMDILSTGAGSIALPKIVAERISLRTTIQKTEAILKALT